MHTTISSRSQSVASTCSCRPKVAVSRHVRSLQFSTTTSRCVSARAKKKADADDGGVSDVAKSAVKLASGLVDTASNWVPDSVPRPVAKGGVAVVGTMIVFSLVQKVLSTLFTVALLGGGAYVWYKSKSGSGDDEDDDDRDKGKRSDDIFRMDGEDDALSEARRIMKKYTK